MRNEIPTLGWIHAKYRFEESRRGLKGPSTGKGVLTGQCGRNLDAGPDDPTNRCLRSDGSGLETRIQVLVVDKVITSQQAEEWIKEALPQLKHHGVRGSCLEQTRKERKHVYQYNGRRCGGVMVTQDPL